MAAEAISLDCVPDMYLTGERLHILFNDFRARVLHGSSTENIFADLVNSVRQPYVAQIMLLQQALLSAAATQHQTQLDTLHEQLNTQHAKEVNDLTEQHHHQLRLIDNERELERAKLGKSIPREWVVGIDVVYGDQEAQKPSSRIKELTGRGDSINYKHSGKYVWLVPKTSTSPEHALTGIDTAIQEREDNTKRSISKGSGGKNRYLLLEASGAEGIYSLNLIRVDYPIGGAPEGYQGSTGDLNVGRDGGYLYLVWKSHYVK